MQRNQQNFNPAPELKTEVLEKSPASLSLFNKEAKDSPTIPTKQIVEILADRATCVVAYEPYLSQVGLDKVFSKDNPRAKVVLEDLIKNHDVNAANNLGVTLLHVLLLAERPDLAMKLLDSEKFNKINFKLCIPANCFKGTMRATALDLAITDWCSPESSDNLKFIETLLANGATPPSTDKQYLTHELMTEIYPLIVLSSAESSQAKHPRSSKEAIDLLCLLSKYGFDLNNLEQYLRTRAFDTEDSNNNRAKEFADSYGFTIEAQMRIFDSFMVELKKAAKDIKPSKPIVEMTEERLDDGRKSLELTFDPMSNPCTIM